MLTKTIPNLNIQPIRPRNFQLRTAKAPPVHLTNKDPALDFSEDEPIIDCTSK